MSMGRINRKKKRTKKISTAWRNVLHANKLEDSLKKISSFITYEKNGLAFNFLCNRVTNLDSDLLEWILDLEERNMKTLYENCDWGWDLKKKKKEMFNSKAWYLIAQSSCGSNVGFSHFRFDMDYGSAVLYCYEIQLETSVRGLGLGKCLMNLLERIAFSNKMEKVVLTVFKHNSEACKFFIGLGYCVDITSPQDDDENRYCYLILSKLYTNYKEQLP